jgi:Flp pilus assembly protein TadG
MKTIASFLSTTCRKLCRARIVAQESGIAAVEFSLILPILLVLWIGGVEVTGALSVDRRLNNLASSMGDLVARDKEVTFAEIDDIFDLSEAALFPYDDTGITLRITAVDMNGAGTANVGWTRKQGTIPTGVQDFADGAQINSFVPAELRVPDSQIIMAEVYHTYRPAVGYVVTGDVQLDDRMFFVPRLVTHVALCEDDDDDDCET